MTTFLEETSKESLKNDLSLSDWKDSIAIKGGMEMMPGYMRECLIPFIHSLLASRLNNVRRMARFQ